MVRGTGRRRSISASHAQDMAHRRTDLLVLGHKSRNCILAALSPHWRPKWDGQTPDRCFMPPFSYGDSQRHKLRDAITVQCSLCNQLYVPPGKFFWVPGEVWYGCRPVDELVVTIPLTGYVAGYWKATGPHGSGMLACRVTGWMITGAPRAVMTVKWMNCEWLRPRHDDGFAVSLSSR